MKTIALSDSAYSRLASWKTGQRDTFSAVVERMIPPKGTLPAALDAARHLPDLPDADFEDLEHSVARTRREIPAPWK